MQLYAGAKESGALKNSLEVLEGLVKTYATPLANKAAAAAPHALAAADAKVSEVAPGGSSETRHALLSACYAAVACWAPWTFWGRPQRGGAARLAVGGRPPRRLLVFPPAVA